MLVWDHDERSVFVADEARFEKLRAGEPDAYPAGFRTYDVFQYDESIAAQMVGLVDSGGWDWSRLTPISEIPAK